MNRLISIANEKNIPEPYQNTPIGLLTEYHNLNRKFESYSNAQLLIGMCMDNRKHLNIPDNFAISVGGVKHIALIGHSNCGMVNLVSKKQLFIEKLAENGGWTIEQAEEHFNNYAPMFEINNEIDFILSETLRLRQRYPKVQIAPMYYKVEDNLLYFIKEE
jgi:carbonic anhydrase